MQSSKRAVLFVDMLGFGALTRGKLNLGNAEFAPWIVEGAGDFPHQLLATRLLLTFRKLLLDTRKAYPSLKVAQLSDCAFIWGAAVDEVLNAGAHLMNAAAATGILCRGGLAYGDTHEPRRVANSLGAFIVGDAVTRAVGLESAGKGARVFTDLETVDMLFQVGSQASLHTIVNPLNGEAVNEWRWYEAEGLRDNYLDPIARRSALRRLIDNYTMFRYSPLYAWSATSEEGRRQLACSIVAISDVLVELTGGSEEFRDDVADLLGGDREARSDMVRRAKRARLSNRALKLLK